MPFANDKVLVLVTEVENSWRWLSALPQGAPDAQVPQLGSEALLSSCPGMLSWRRQGCTLPALARVGGHRSGALRWSNGTRDPWEGADVRPESCVTIGIRRRHRI